MTLILLITAFVSLPFTIFLVRKWPANEKIGTLSTVIMTWATVFMATTAWYQMDQAKTESRIERGQNRAALLEATWYATELVISPIGIDYLYALPHAEQKQIADRLRSIFEAQSKNPLLIEDAELQKLWRDAIGSARTISLIRSYKADQSQEEGVRHHFKSIFDNVLKVSQKADNLK